MSEGVQRPRAIEAPLRHLVGDFRVTVLQGPRQAGKSTVLQRLHDQIGGTYVTLDNDQDLAAVAYDPVGFATSAPTILVDEVQRGGDRLLLAIKATVDAHPQRRFILTGSTNFLTVPTLSESLAGRAALLQLWPFSEGELAGRPETFIDSAFASPREIADDPVGAWPREQYWEAIVRGGFPEPLALSSEFSRRTWFESYLSTVTLRDLARVADVRRPQDLLRLVRHCLSATAREVVKTEWSPVLGIERHRLTAYLALLETAYLVADLPPWAPHVQARARRHPKIMASDTGLVTQVLGIDEAALAATVSPMRGQLVETFVHSQIQRALGWSRTRASLSHWRDPRGREVDLVIEAPDGRIVGIEVKAAASVTTDDTVGLRALAEVAGPRFVHGFVLHLGERCTRFGSDITAAPASHLWLG